MKENRFFRAGIGTVIYNDRGEVAFFRRVKYPAGVWQFQQGGIDVGESVETALWRELYEETGLGKAHFEAIDTHPMWLTYANPDALTNPERDRMGQSHQWFYLKLNEGMRIDLRRAADHEFDDMRWTTFAEALAETDNFKRPVYEALYQHFTQHIRPT